MLDSDMVMSKLGGRVDNSYPYFLDASAVTALRGTHVSFLVHSREHKTLFRRRIPDGKET